MRTFYSLNNFLKSATSSNRFAVTIGVFDGVHRAHKKIIASLGRKAKEKHLSTLVITFHPHPANILNAEKKVPLLISLKHRLRLLQELGADYALVLNFDKRMARMSADDFVEKILDKIYIGEIVVGKNFFFGKGKKGTLGILKKYSKRNKFGISAVNDIKSGQKTISSTWIRKLIIKGRLYPASRLLSRPVTVLGTVVKGEKRGRIIGFKTANIDPHHEAIPPSGVYAVKILLDKRIFCGILNIGIRPTFKESAYEEAEPTIEVHIFNFDNYIYGKDLEITFVKRIRTERRFKDIRSLVRQIQNDVKRAKYILR